MKPRRTILIIGKRGTGKSTLLKDILYHMRKKVDIGFAMTPTFDTQQMFADCLPKSHIYNEYSLEAVGNIIGAMTSLKEQGKERDAVLVLDDCMFEKGIMRSTEMREIHMNGRHLSLTFINAIQYLMDATSDIRSQIDYVFCLKDNVISNRQKLYKYFFGIFDKYEEFSLVFDTCTNNHECIVLDNTQVTNTVEDSVFYYKGDPTIGKFRLGRSIYFKLDHYYGLHSKTQQTLTKLPEPIKQKQKIKHVEKDDNE